eukprot:8689404-Pyramimonas_sp.AAC.1
MPPSPCEMPPSPCEMPPPPCEMPIATRPPGAIRLGVVPRPARLAQSDWAWSQVPGAAVPRAGAPRVAGAGGA